MDEYQGIYLEGIEEKTPEEFMTVITGFFESLPPGGVIEFKMTDFRKIVEYYNYKREVDSSLLSCLCQPRGAIWDELSMVRKLLDVGFYRIWTGNTPDCNMFEVYVKAVKLNTTTVS